MKISVILPTYNRAPILLQTLRTVLNQSFQNFEVLVWDDASTDDTEEVVGALSDRRIVYHKNNNNLGYGPNLRAAYGHATGDIIYLLGDDDLLFPWALRRTHDQFLRGDEIGVVSRPFYMFWDDPLTPVWAVSLPCDPKRDAMISLSGDRRAVECLFGSLGQLSGLAFRKEYADAPFNDDVFTAHIYPIASVLKEHKAVFLKDWTVAVRIPLSMSTHRAEIYSKSPLQSYVDMLDAIYGKAGMKEIRDSLVDWIMRMDLASIISIKTATGDNRKVLREAAVAVRYRPRTLLNPSFYGFTAAGLLVPARPLRRLIDAYKLSYMAKRSRERIRALGMCPRQIYVDDNLRS